VIIFQSIVDVEFDFRASAWDVTVRAIQHVILLLVCSLHVVLDKTLKLPMVLGHKIVHQLPRDKDAYLVRRLSGKTCQRRRNGQSLNTTDWHHALKRPSITTQDTQNIVIKIFVYNPNMKPLFNILSWRTLEAPAEIQGFKRAYGPHIIWQY